ncbi:interferon-inducible GTPase 5-like [Rana temporaria]|uniref:interferon-inducible GTPase 5-like n=1 Tax=Rana temporaria TaxID=8407 RepID=UPI001AACFEBE|nr:interferon-inducible GTPase 5-like [Rana temporaria]
MDSSATKQLGKEVIEALRKGNPAEAFEKVKKYLSDVENTPLNVAITGESGSGKSTFINAIRGLGDEEPESAQTDVVETTMEPTPYPHPRNKSVTYWDLPGIGTPNFKASEYLDKVQFQRYDFFIIIASERFKENHSMLAEEIQNMKKKFYFVRSKIDRDLRESQERRAKTYNEKELLEKIRQDCVNSLKKDIKDITDDSVFLISSFKPVLFDFSRLLKTFEEELPSHKRYVYLRALPNISSEAIQMKLQALMSIVPLVALQAIAASIIPGLSDVNEMLSLTHRIGQYVESFGLDQKSLNDLEERSGRNDVKSLMKSPFVKDEITYDLVSRELEKRRGSVYMGVKTFFSWVPVLSATVSGPMSASACIDLLYSVLNEIADDAKVAFEAAFGCSEKNNNVMIA